MNPSTPVDALTDRSWIPLKLCEKAEYRSAAIWFAGFRYLIFTIAHYVHMPADALVFGWYERLRNSACRRFNLDNVWIPREKLVQQILLRGWGDVREGVVLVHSYGEKCILYSPGRV